MLKLIIEGKELHISEHAKQWFLKEFLEGKEGPFTCQTTNGVSHNSIDTVPLTKQPGLFTTED